MEDSLHTLPEVEAEVAKTSKAVVYEGFYTFSDVENGRIGLAVARDVGSPDPFEASNRCVFAFNDVMLAYIITPGGKVYSLIFPKCARDCLDGVGHNLAFPARSMSCLLQGKCKESGIECTRFLINTVMGGAGAFDVADLWFDIKGYEEDFGQAFGFWGVGPGFYIVLPFAGPTTVRDGIGLIFDYAFDIKTWIPVPGVQAFFFLNYSSLNLDEYMAMRKTSADLYQDLQWYWYLTRKVKIKN